VALDAEENELLAHPAALHPAVQCRRLRGLGTGGDPSNARTACEENLEQIKSFASGANVMFAVAGLGGGFGTGALPLAVKSWKQAGATVVVLLVLPFACEGRRRSQLAAGAFAEVQREADAILALPNESVFRLVGPDASVAESFTTTNRLAADTLRGLWQLVVGGGPVAIPLADLCGALRRRTAEGSFACVEAAGSGRAEQVMARLRAHPLLDGNPAFEDADLLLVNLAGGSSLAMAEVDSVMKYITSQVPEAQLKFGVSVDDSLENRMVVTLIAAQTIEPSEPEQELATERPRRTTPLESDLLAEKTQRPAPRVIPPPPEFAPEKRERIMAQHAKSVGRGRGRSKSKSNQLQFDLVSKGRFEKSEPTIHHGEDLDLPTYLRRGLPMN
jgi:cell division protein FtsZ